MRGRASDMGIGFWMALSSGLYLLNPGARGFCIRWLKVSGALFTAVTLRLDDLLAALLKQAKLLLNSFPRELFTPSVPSLSKNKNPKAIP